MKFPPSPADDPGPVAVLAVMLLVVAFVAVAAWVAFRAVFS